MKTKKCNGCSTKVSSRNKWCDDCIKNRQREQNKKCQIVRRKANQKICEECKEAPTNTKYCNPCSQKVKARNDREWRSKQPKLCRECKCDISYRAKHAKLCEKCVVIVDARNYEKRKADMRAGKVVKQEVDLSRFTSRGTISYYGLGSLAV